MSDFSTPAGWYPDGDGWERRWDGTAWTDERRRTTPTPPAAPPLPPAPQAPPTMAPPAYSPQGYAPPAYGAPSGPPPGQLPASPAQGWGPPAGYGYQSPLPPQQPRRKGPVGLFVALGVVLLLIAGTGITLAITHPWSKDKGDSTTTTKDKPSTVLGDLDGDGLGDVRAVIEDGYDSHRQITGTSDGKRFKIATLSVNSDSGDNTVILDFDGDGKPDAVTYQYDDDAHDLSLSSTSPGFQISSAIPIPFASLYEYGGARVQVEPGDFDGDGNADLLVVGQNNQKVDIYVMAGHGDGSFDSPKKWISVPNMMMSVAHLLVGDFDGDGKTDVWTVMSTVPLTRKDYQHGYVYENLGTTVLTSTGTGFTPPHVVTPSESTRLYSIDGVIAGDVTGTGRDSLVVLDSDSYDKELTVTAYNVSTGGLVPETGLAETENGIGDRDVVGAVATDVDGDGDADIVYLAKNYDAARFYGFRVILTDGHKLATSQAWGDLPPCSDRYCELQSMS
ncbi:FG-GAP-like repeat-containing protein [Nocardioides ultimimeridianus]